MDIKLIANAICAVSKDMAANGIDKDRTNQSQGYKFRGIDDVYNALAPVICKHNLIIIPRMLSRECTERQSSKGGALFTVLVEAEFDFISPEDGSMLTAKTYGEAMDSADKATNKAMSAAYKYATIMTFCIPTHGNNDADEDSHTVKPVTKKTPNAASESDINSLENHKHQMSICIHPHELKAFSAAAYHEFKNDPAARAELKEVYEQKKAELAAKGKNPK